MSRSRKRPEGAAVSNRTGLVLHFVRGSAFLFLLSIFCSMMVTLLQLYIPRVIEEAVDSLESGGNLVASALLIVVLALGAVLFRYGRISFNEQAAQTMMKTMRDLDDSGHLWHKFDFDAPERLQQQRLAAHIHSIKRTFMA